MMFFGVLVGDGAGSGAGSLGLGVVGPGLGLKAVRARTLVEVVGAGAVSAVAGGLSVALARFAAVPGERPATVGASPASASGSAAIWLEGGVAVSAREKVTTADVAMIAVTVAATSWWDLLSRMGGILAVGRTIGEEKWCRWRRRSGRRHTGYRCVPGRCPIAIRPAQGLPSSAIRDTIVSAARAKSVPRYVPGTRRRAADVPKALPA